VTAVWDQEIVPHQSCQRRHGASTMAAVPKSLINLIQNQIQRNLTIVITAIHKVDLSKVQNLIQWHPLPQLVMGVPASK